MRKIYVGTYSRPGLFFALPYWYGIMVASYRTEQKLHKKNKGSLFDAGFLFSSHFFPLATDFDLPPTSFFLAAHLRSLKAVVEIIR